jgi:hypothetical protein
MRDGEMHTMAGFGALLLTAALCVPTVLLTDSRAQTGPALDDMESIEASLAYKKPNAPKQPQKVKQAPNPEVKPEGVSRDENKKVDEKKPEDKKDEKKKPDEKVDPLAKYRRDQDPDTDVGKESEAVGAFDGSQFGMGDVTKGDPYFQKLVADLEWSAPELAKAGAESPVGCIQLTKEGKIPQTTFKVQGDGDLQPLAENAVKELKKKRNENPEEVPTHLLRALTTKWVCFKFTAQH